MSRLSEIELTRRTLARGAAWSLPVIAAATAVPMAAASGCTEPTTVEKTIAPTVLGQTGSAPKATDQFVVPAGVTTLTFSMLGGGGGGHDSGVLNATGGAGAVITGTITVSEGQLIDMVAGNGGIDVYEWNVGFTAGGDGFGNGGDVPATPAGGDWFAGGGSGGGGSAILINGTAVVIAGGGGGGGCASMNPPTGWTMTQGTGGDGGLNGGKGGDVNVNGHASSDSNGAAPGGGGATGSGGGVPTGTAATGGNRTENGWTRRIGTAGGAGNLVSGGNGANGTVGDLFNFNSQGDFGVVSAGGGGGWAGGASSGSTGRIWELDGAGGDYVYAAGAGAGGGSSYVDSAVAAATVGTGTNRATTQLRRPGFVTITYEVPCPAA